MVGYSNVASIALRRCRFRRWVLLPVGKYLADIFSAVQTGYKYQGYEPWHASIDIESGQTFRRDFKLRLIVDVESARSRPDLYARPQRPTGAFRPAPAMMELSLLKRTEPANPKNLIGTITLQALTDVDGTVISLRLMSPAANPDLARAAVEAVSHWMYRPPVIQGEERQAQFQFEVVVQFAPKQ